MGKRKVSEKPCALVLGASKGLGLEIARQAKERDMIALAVARSVTGSYATMHEGWVGKRADITDPGAVVDILDLHREFDITHVFWVAGIPPKGTGVQGQKQSFMGHGREDVEAMFQTHLIGPINILRECMRRVWRTPIHLVTVASTSSYRLRENETLYCTVKAAKAHFTRNFAAELARDLPGSKTTLVNPGGMRTDFLKHTADVSNWMDPAVIAEIIWNRVGLQTSSFTEFNILRQPDGSPNIIEGPQTPEAP